MIKEQLKTLLSAYGSPNSDSGRPRRSEPGTERATAGNAADVFSDDAAVELYTRRLETEGFFEQEEKAVERFFTKSGGRVLDVGCGAGRVSHLLAERGFDVTGIDISEPLVERARSTFPDIEFRVADVTDTDFPAESFDYAVFSFFGLDYVLPKADRLRALREVFRVLKPGGLFLFSTHNSWYLLADALRGDRTYVKDFLFSPKNAGRLLSRSKYQSVPLGDLETYLSNPLHQWTQLRRCGLTPVSIVGRRESALKLLEHDLHFVAKK